LRFIEKENGGGTNKKALAFYISENGKMEKRKNGICENSLFCKFDFFTHLKGRGFFGLTPSE